jgi:hypothetical protein
MRLGTNNGLLTLVCVCMVAVPQGRNGHISAWSLVLPPPSVPTLLPVQMGQCSGLHVFLSSMGKIRT